MAGEEEHLPTPSDTELSVPLLSQGAEARVYKIRYCGRDAVAKQRFRKNYRHPVLDAKITSRRLHQEARSLLRARKLGVCTPVVYAIESETFTIVSEFIDGVSVKDALLNLEPNKENFLPVEAKKIAKLIGSSIAKLHDGGLVHGDLTTSNMILSNDCTSGEPHSQKIVMIDFGLSYNSKIAEDLAVDLYVLERALISLHSRHEGMMGAILEEYKSSSKFWSSTLNKLAQVRLRGRKRVMIG